jgi:hypothetical protein
MAEEHLLSTWALTAEEFEASQGRGAPPVWELAEAVRPNKMGDTLESDSATFWGAIQARLRQLSLHLISQGNQVAQHQRLVRCIQRLTSKAQLCVQGLSEATQEKATKLLEELHDPRWTRATLVARVLAEKARKIADEASQQMRRKKNES